MSRETAERRAKASAEWDYLTTERQVKRPGMSWPMDMRAAYGARAQVNWDVDPPELLLIERPRNSPRGAGTKLLKVLLGICDRHRLSLRAVSAPYDPGLRADLSDAAIQRLLRWYLRFGFEVVGTRVDGIEIIRRPR